MTVRVVPSVPHAMLVALPREPSFARRGPNRPESNRSNGKSAEAAIGRSLVGGEQALLLVPDRL
ncbi:MAG: hypothetical protein GY708_29300 [Actinomycetia bacterium]|nr:hypothetical protein [Actinomycetes bacterium]MCP4086053.1 hypothetical protein [Actinomycetes bacterium]